MIETTIHFGMSPSTPWCFFLRASRSNPIPLIHIKTPFQNHGFCGVIVFSWRGMGHDGTINYYQVSNRQRLASLAINHYDKYHFLGGIGDLSYINTLSSIIQVLITSIHHSYQPLLTDINSIYPPIHGIPIEHINVILYTYIYTHTHAYIHM